MLVLFLFGVISGTLVMTASSTNKCKGSPFMPNIGYLLQGYDIYKGNPLQEGTLHLDPGLRHPIFKATYKDACTADLRFQIPEGTSVLDCSGCSLSFSTKQVSDMDSYRHSLSLKVSAEAGYDGFSFSASYGHKSVENKIKNYHHTFTHSEASCCSYKAQMLSGTLPIFSDNFKSAIKNLPESYKTDDDKKKYQDIIDNFGTHYNDQMIMGSLFGQASELSANALSTMKKENININLAAGYSGLDVTASAKYADKSKTDMAHKFQQNTSHQRIYTVGPPPPEGNKMNAWVQEANKSPGPISQKLKSIISLIENQDSLNISQAVKQNLKKVFNNYCEHLREKGLVSSCHPKAPECRKAQSAIAIFCQGGTTIHITSAVWRTNVKECSDVIQTTEHAREICEGNSFCMLQSVIYNVQGIQPNLKPPNSCNPDSGRVQTLDLHICHTCEPLSGVPFCAFRFGTHPITIGCNIGTTVNITFALWGNPENNCPGNETKSTELARSFCKGKHMCDMSAENANISDPCAGKHKYLYLCNTCIV